MDEDKIVEIHPFKKHKRAILHDLIVIDDDDKDSDDLVIIGEKVGTSNKGKAIESTHEVVDVSDYISLKNNHTTDSFQSSWSLELTKPKIQGSRSRSSNFQIEINNVDHSSRTELSSSRIFSQAESVASQRSGHGLNLSLGMEASKSENLSKSFQSKINSTSLVDNSDVGKLLHAGKKPAATESKCVNQEGRSSSSCHANCKDEITRKFHSFKQFDIIDYCYSYVHHYAFEKSSTKPRTKKWAKIIQKEWKILEDCLPDLIFVRVYETRMDLLRAVIIGAEGTPYHDGLFFLDLYFPSNYPVVPPLVTLKSDVYNPVFTTDGIICLSLLHTTNKGSGTETWIPNVSTTLQILVSIQGLILTENPTRTLGLVASLVPQDGMFPSFLSSLETMISALECPPKEFKDLVVDHFISRAHDILGACKAYMESAPDKNRLSSCMKSLVKEFARIGVKHCEQFLS